MKKSYGRMLAGVIFLLLGGSRIVTDYGGIAVFGLLMTLYGLFSVGHGIYLYRKGE